ncbi:hypothetical protein D3C78_1846250 [compost metagenome]
MAIPFPIASEANAASSTEDRGITLPARGLRTVVLFTACGRIFSLFSVFVFVFSSTPFDVSSTAFTFFLSSKPKNIVITVANIIVPRAMIA